jgi:hypothetical protein
MDTHHFEVRSAINKNSYNHNSPMDSIMERLFSLADIEHNQKFDAALVKRLAKIVDFLPNLED